MRRDVTLIDNESGVKVLAALDQMDDAEIVECLRNALKRKLEHDVGPVPEDDSLPSRMERFFDNIVDIQPEEKPLSNEVVIELIDDIIKTLEEFAKDPESEREGLVEMYSEDAEGFVQMKSLILEGKIKEAIKLHRNMDSSPRDRLWGRNYKEAFQLGYWLAQ